MFTFAFEMVHRVMKVGKKLRDEGEKVYFAISGLDEMSNELTECGIEDRDGDKPVVCAFNQQNKKFQMKEDFR